jgi:hypothetical protein
MTIDECMAKAVSALDERYAESADDYEDVLRAHGASAEGGDRDRCREPQTRLRN